VIGFLLGLTLRQQVFRKSTLLLLGLALLPVLVAVVFRLSDATEEPAQWTAASLFKGLLVTAVLPLTALMFGTSVLGDELEDGTAVYLLTKPLPRWEILLPKVIAPWLLTSALVAGSTLLSGLIAIQDADASIVYGAAAAMVFGALAYTVIFVFLSVMTNHALIIGLVYVFIWEGALGALFEGLRYFSVRHYTLGLADSFAGNVPNTFDAYMNGTTALLLALAVSAIAAVLTNYRLERIEIRERP
jgi:ABC-2 type transport system permease protein